MLLNQNQTNGIRVIGAAQTNADLIMKLKMLHNIFVQAAPVHPIEYVYQWTA